MVGAVPVPAVMGVALMLALAEEMECPKRKGSEDPQILHTAALNS